MDAYKWTPTAPYFATSLTPMTIQFSPYWPSTPFLSMFPMSPALVSGATPTHGAISGFVLASTPPSSIGCVGNGVACAAPAQGEPKGAAPATANQPVSKTAPVTPTKLEPSVSIDSLYAKVPLMGPVPGSDVYATPRKRARVIDDIDSSDSEAGGSCYTPSPVSTKKPRGRPSGSFNRKPVRKQRTVTKRSQSCIEPKVILNESELRNLNIDSEKDVLNAYLGQSDLGDPIRHGDGYQCGECRKVYKHFKHARRHMLTHLGVKPHSCPSCETTFSRKDTMQRHLVRCSK